MKTLNISPETFGEIIEINFPFAGLTKVALRSYYNGKRFPGPEDAYWIARASKLAAKIRKKKTFLTEYQILFPLLRKQKFDTLIKIHEQNKEIALK